MRKMRCGTFFPYSPFLCIFISYSPHTDITFCFYSVALNHMAVIETVLNATTTATTVFKSLVDERIQRRH